MTQDIPLCFAADIVGMQLHLVDDRFRASGIRHVKIGPWKIDFEVVVCSDIMVPEGISLFCRLNKELWMYMWVDANAQNIVVFDGVLAGLKPANVKEFGNKSVGDTLLKLKKFTRAHFIFDAITGKWEENVAFDLDKAGAVTSPKNVVVVPSAA